MMILVYLALLLIFLMGLLGGFSAFFLTFRKKTMPLALGIPYLITAIAACALVIVIIASGDAATYFPWIVVCTGILLVVGWLQAQRKARQIRDERKSWLH
ncbi:MAG: hypothetical protein ACRENA_13845 [Vulcanimicrobiaceae bacterium]